MANLTIQKRGQHENGCQQFQFFTETAKIYVKTYRTSNEKKSNIHVKLFVRKSIY